MVASRWGLVICDEVQDTSTQQWDLLRLLATRKFVLLGDPRQMIYTFVKGVSPHQFQQVREWVDKEVLLLPSSHRDPSGVIPSVAEAVRVRDFKHEAVLEAIRTGRLYIHFGVDGDDYNVLASEIDKARKMGSRDVVFSPIPTPRSARSQISSIALGLNTPSLESQRRTQRRWGQWQSSAPTLSVGLTMTRFVNLSHCS